MPLFAKKNRFMLLLAIAVMILVADGITSSYFDLRSDIVDQANDKANSLRDARDTLAHEQKLRQLLVKLGPTIQSDPSTVEGHLLHMLHDWEQRTGVTNTSFDPRGSIEDQGYVLITIKISASGNLAAVSGLLYRIETSSIPLRVDDVQVEGKSESGGNVQIHLNVSTLCRARTSKANAPRLATAYDHTGGQG